MKWLSHAIQNGNKTDLAYGHIQLRAPLNTSLQHILQALITKNTPLAFFCYALLLTGKINSAHAKENSLKEKRILKAIDYFVFAAKDPLLQPHINFLLWHIKTTSPFFWVSKKIDRLNKFTIPTDVLLSSTISGSYLAKQSHTFFRPEIGKDNWSIRGIAGSRCSLQNIKRK
ncbi:MAG: hypothetical protein EPN84_04500 [Legionella sp.]|nr:MAG: hypothetical protein EPN84_04500 [Legionella sp.]